MKKSKQTKAAYVISFAVLLLILAAGCSDTGGNKASSTAANGTAAQEKIKVNVAINGSLNALVILKNKGWLEEEFKALNAEVVWSEFSNGPPILESLSAKRVDLSLLGDGATISGASAGLPFQVIALLSKGAKFNAILVPPHSPIQSVKDLKGKKVGLAKGTTAHVYLLKVLAKYGLSIDDVQLINLQPDDGAAAFASGQLDAWGTWDPHITNLTKTNKARTIAWDEDNILAPSSLIGRTEFLNEHPEVVTAFLKSYKRAIDWMNANQDETAEIFANRVKIPKDIMKSLVSNLSFTVSGYANEALQAQQQSADQLLEHGFIKKKLDFQSVVNNEWIEKVIK
ncbi:aliphatic sulfonate ABC transporter substrate-binding protein [Paenibacillus agilis]|nr:aliphatic sulfonate ABC transporter substrate-binding protein [Paenibacillus agilis]